MLMFTFFTTKFKGEAKILDDFKKLNFSNIENISSLWKNVHDLLNKEK